MQTKYELTSIFLRHVRADAKLSVLSPDDMAKFEPLLRHTWEASRNTWSGIPLGAEPYVRHLAAHVPPCDTGDAAAAALQFVQATHTDFYLACACTLLIPSAHEAFDRQLIARLPEMLRGLRQPAEAIDEACQQLRIKLLVGRPDVPPKIAEYAGRGRLLSWLWVIGTRDILRNQRAAKRRPDDPNVALLSTVCDALPASGADPELALIKRKYSRAYNQALADAFEALPDDEAHLLYMSLIEKRMNKEIAFVYEKDASTISRWLQSTREQIYATTQRILQKRLGLVGREFESLLRVVASDLHVSLSRLLVAKLIGPQQAMDRSSQSHAAGYYCQPR